MTCNEGVIDKINDVGAINPIFPDEMHATIKDSGGSYRI